MNSAELGINPYFDYGTKTLYNKLNITDPEILQKAEHDHVANRIAGLQAKPIQGNFDFAHLKAVHAALFQDVYRWAGQPRENFNSAKIYEEGKPAHRFTPSADIEKQAAALFQRLSHDGQLKHLPREEFVAKATAFIAELNQIHPFPEGNGRTQRVFLQQLGSSAGHPLDLSVGTEHRVYEARLATLKGDLNPMHRIIAEAADPQRVEALRKAIDHLETHLGPRTLQANYVATTTAGEHYAGTLVDRAGKDVMFQTPDRHIMIGHSVDIPTTASPRDHIEFTATNGKSQQQAIQPADPGHGFGI